MALYQNNFNFLRLLGASLVIFSHSYYVTGQDAIEPVYQLTHSRLEASAFGLCIFFFISGYFVTKSAHESGSVLLFLKKRIFRIYPALIVLVLLTVFVLGPCVTQLTTKEYFTDNTTWQYLYTLTGIRIRAELPGVFRESNYFMTAVNASLWTIALELYLYLSLTLFLVPGVIKNKKIFSWIAVGIAATCFLVVALKPGLNFFYIKYFNLTGIFFLGSFVFSSSLAKKNLLFLLLAAAAVYTVLSLSRLPYIKPDFLLLVIISIFTYLIGFTRSFSIRLGNDISYGLYIFAFPVQQLVFRLLGFDRSIPLNLLLTFAITIPVAFLSWKFIEKPCINFNRKKAAIVT